MAALLLIALASASLASALAQECDPSLALRNLEGFINSAGGFVSSKVALQDAPHMGRGFFATADLPKGFEFIRIPLGMVITPALAIHEFPDMHPVSDIDALANFVQLHMTQRAKSRYHAYVLALPEQVPVGFMRAESELRARLPMNDAVAAAQMKRDIVRRGAQLGDADLYAERVSVIHSRVFVVRALDRERNEWVPSPALVPGVDFLNLSEQPNVDCETDEASQFFGCRTLVPVSRGQQLFAPYGQKFTSAAERDAFTLMHYGFDSADEPLASAQGTCINYLAHQARIVKKS